MPGLRLVSFLLFVVVICCYFTFFKNFFYIDMYLGTYISHEELMYGSRAKKVKAGERF